jgi:hypothetical protein
MALLHWSERENCTGAVSCPSKLDDLVANQADATFDMHTTCIGYLSPREEAESFGTTIDTKHMQVSMLACWVQAVIETASFHDSTLHPLAGCLPTLWTHGQMVPRSDHLTSPHLSNHATTYKLLLHTNSDTLSINIDNVPQRE